MLDSALVLLGKEGDIVREKLQAEQCKQSVRIKPKHANSKIKLLSRKIKNATKYLQLPKYLQSLLTFF